MKLKKINLTLSTAIICLVAVSCSKTTTPGKLDGEWKAISGIEKGTYVSEDPEETYTSTVDLTFDGTKFTGTIKDEFNGSTNTETVDYPFTFTIKFNKDDNTFESTSITSYEQEYGYIFAYNSDDESDIYGVFNEVRNINSTEVKTGVFYLAGGNGDYEKNSILQLDNQTITNTSVYTSKYYDFDTNQEVNLSGKYTYNNNGDLVLIPTGTQTLIDSEKNKNDFTYLFIKDFKKKEATISNSYLSNLTEQSGSIKATEKDDYVYELNLSKQ